MADQFDDLIREIAIKHGIAISREDPILILQTINARLLQESAQAHQVQLNRQKEELEAMSMRWGTDAKDRAESILNAALTSSKNIMAHQMQENAAAAGAGLRLEVDTALERFTGQVRDARRIAILNVMAACITMAAAAITVFGLFTK